MKPKNIIDQMICPVCGSNDTDSIDNDNGNGERTESWCCRECPAEWTAYLYCTHVRITQTEEDEE